MPRAGGGGNAGGFGGSGGNRGFGGGGFGGGPRPGGFGGPHHHGPHYHGGWYHRPYYRRPIIFFGGGGGGFFGFAILLIVFFSFLGVFVMMTLSTVASVTNGGEIVYDEVRFQDYADTRYREEFGAYDGYEDNLLIVFLTNETSDKYYTITWVGDNVRTEIVEMFGNEYTEYGRQITRLVPAYYYHSLDTDLASVMRNMTDSVSALSLESSFYYDEGDVERAPSKLVNYTELDINKYLLDDALVKFTEQTAIPTVIVVDDMENVFTTTLGSDIFFLLIMLAVVIFLGFIIVKGIKELTGSKKKNGGNNQSFDNGSNGSGNRDNSDGSKYGKDYDSSRYNKRF